MYLFRGQAGQYFQCFTQAHSTKHHFPAGERIREEKGSFFLPQGNRSITNTKTAAQKHDSALTAVCNVTETLKQKAEAQRLSWAGSRRRTLRALLPSVRSSTCRNTPSTFPELSAPRERPCRATGQQQHPAKHRHCQRARGPHPRREQRPKSFQESRESLSKSRRQSRELSVTALELRTNAVLRTAARRRFCCKCTPQYQLPQFLLRKAFHL